MKVIDYEFRGMRHFYGCGENVGPHLPHIIGNYRTQNYGILTDYCCGKEGDGIDIVCTSEYTGTAAEPGYWKGFAMVKEEKADEVLSILITVPIWLDINEIQDIIARYVGSVALVPGVEMSDREVVYRITRVEGTNK